MMAITIPEIKYSAFSPEELLKTKELLNNNELSEDEKQYIVKIIAFLKIVAGDRQKEICILPVLDFCSNKEHLKYKEQFDGLLKSMIHLIDSNNKRIEEGTKFMSIWGSGNNGIAYRIMSVFSSKGIPSGMDSQAYYSLLNRILSEQKPGDVRRWEIISNILGNTTLAKYPRHMEIAIDVALKSKVGTGGVDGSIPYVISILTNEKLLSLDEDDYRRAVGIAYDNIYFYALNSILKQNIPENRLKLALKYLSNAMDSDLTRFYCCGWEHVEQSATIDLFSIVYNPKLLAMSDDDDYESYLKIISDSKNKLSVATALSSDKTSLDQETAAINIIEEKDRQRFDDWQETMYYVSQAAISPVLVEQGLKEYNEVLSTISDFSFGLSLNELEEKYKLCYSKSQGAVKLLNCPDLYCDNFSRFQCVLKKIEGIQYHEAVDAIVQFATHPNSAYYSDEEFAKALNLISSCNTTHIELHLDYDYGTKKTNACDLAAALLTNLNIPYTPSKEQLFKIIEDNANSDNGEHKKGANILEGELNKQNKAGRHNIMFEGAPDGVVFGMGLNPAAPKVKKYV